MQDQKIIGNEINTLLHTLGEKQNQKLKYEDANLDELRKQLFANTYCVQKNNKISKLKVANKEDVLFTTIRIITFMLNLYLLLYLYRSCY